MRLSDVMSHAGLARYAEVALILFLIAFAAIVIRLFRSPRREIERASRLPLERDDTPDPPSGANHE
jgi:cbb3-type cytochrome oxidase subunit 3